MSFNKIFEYSHSHLSFFDGDEIIHLQKNINWFSRVKNKVRCKNDLEKVLARQFYYGVKCTSRNHK